MNNLHEKNNNYLKIKKIELKSTSILDEKLVN